MRLFAILFLAALLPGFSVVAQSNSTALKESVTLEINADLLRRAREMNLDLAAVMEKQLEAEIVARGGTASVTHQSLLVAAFDNFEAMLFTPLKVDRTTPVAGVKAACQSVQESVGQLIAHAETRKSLALPDSLEEAQQLNQYIAKRFHAIQAGMRQAGGKIRASGKILEANCPELNANEAVAKNAMQTALAQYGPEGWCRVMMKKPQAAWNMQDAGTFAKVCQGVKPN
ncbi:DUF3012 domain-containing protein [Pelagibius sp. Alg239-R121]|uniref:DUF3012 domain-containing protein n=1 Tax=Pelagibius sp. Alg239-R121 TaxID=2993448 RepID=UPI0024A6665D|nr:DUF3012 domain-containing protein [Pelagibius sp. Alg239-R121]